MFDTDSSASRNSTYGMLTFETSGQRGQPRAKAIALVLSLTLVLILLGAAFVVYRSGTVTVGKTPLLMEAKIQAPTMASAQPQPPAAAPHPTTPQQVARAEPAQSKSAIPPPPVQAPATIEPRASAPAPAESGPAAGVAQVQIGAFPSQAAADKGWSAAMQAAPHAGAGKGKRVEPVQRGGTTLYRGLVTGFPSRTAANAFCRELSAAGRQCFVK